MHVGLDVVIESFHATDKDVRLLSRSQQTAVRTTLQVRSQHLE